MKITIPYAASHPTLAAQLESLGHPLDLRCAGAGTCGRCKVTLLSGEWRVAGEPVKTPCAALACKTELVGESGEVDVPETSLAPAAGGRILADWRGMHLPVTDETVVAIDIGTTTVAAVKIHAGRAVAKASCYNSQSKLGDNVISRIHIATTGKLGELRALVIADIERLLKEIDGMNAARIAVAGNTVMECIFHGIDPGPIGVIPFTPPARTFPVRTDLFGGVPVFTVPSISGYVGGDLTAGMSVADLKPGEMLVDIGTNCEIIFNSAKAVYCTAAAAGPAFEGAGISCGSRATDGAIDHFFPDGSHSTIGGVASPVGICGSGFIDFLAVKHRDGALTDFGRYDPSAESCRISDGIAVHESDIEQILKAKAAVFSGIQTLENHCGEKARKIYLAGGFAQYIDLQNAIEIGMLPQREYEIIGNTSLAGAALLACDPSYMTRLESLIDIPTELPLNTLPDFQDNYIDALLLP
ncbi:MAG: ASKHA domain-containing protein [Kiritimatiellaeota bacterium]|nr:ASKHA domain-containing protein [Kiritimatiellota bacterium]